MASNNQLPEQRRPDQTRPDQRRVSVCVLWENEFLKSWTQLHCWWQLLTTSITLNYQTLIREFCSKLITYITKYITVKASVMENHLFHHQDIIISSSGWCSIINLFNMFSSKIIGFIPRCQILVFSNLSSVNQLQWNWIWSEENIFQP